MCGFAAGDPWPKLLFEPKQLSEEEQALVDKLPLGSKGNPVRCAYPEGEVRYLERLMCPNGKPPKFKRLGSYGAGPYDTVIDGYQVKCKRPKRKTMIFMDMYHEGYVEQQVVPGFDRG